MYQEYLAKTLTDKYSNLSLQMDKVIHEANTELELFGQKLQSVFITAIRQDLGLLTF